MDSDEVFPTDTATTQESLFRDLWIERLLQEGKFAKYRSEEYDGTRIQELYRWLVPFEISDLADAIRATIGVLLMHTNPFFPPNTRRNKNVVMFLRDLQELVTKYREKDLIWSEQESAKAGTKRIVDGNVRGAQLAYVLEQLLKGVGADQMKLEQVSEAFYLRTNIRIPQQAIDEMMKPEKERTDRRDSRGPRYFACELIAEHKELLDFDPKSSSSIQSALRRLTTAEHAEALSSASKRLAELSVEQRELVVSAAKSGTEMTATETFERLFELVKEADQLRDLMAAYGGMKERLTQLKHSPLSDLNEDYKSGLCTEDDFNNLLLETVIGPLRVTPQQLRAAADRMERGQTVMSEILESSDSED